MNKQLSWKIPYGINGLKLLQYFMAILSDQTSGESVVVYSLLLDVGACVGSLFVVWS